MRHFEAGLAVVDFVTETPIKLSKVCRLFEISRRTLDNWISQGLHVKPMGEKLLYTTREELQRFSDRFERNVQPEASSDDRAALRAEQEVRERYAL